MRSRKKVCISDILAAERIVRHRIFVRPHNSKEGYFKKIYKKVKSMSKN